MEGQDVQRELRVLDAIKEGTLPRLVEQEGYRWESDFLAAILNELAYYAREDAGQGYRKVAEDTCSALKEYHSFGSAE